MIEGHIIFNAILYSIVIAYILYINFSAYYQTGTGFLKALVNLFQNWIFRTVYLLIVGFFALDLFPYGGFVLAILLTIAFLNTNMLVYKKDVEESMVGNMNKEEKKPVLPSDGMVGGTAQTGTAQTGTASPVSSQIGTAQTGTASPVSSQIGTAQTGNTFPVSSQIGTAQTGNTFPATQNGTAQQVNTQTFPAGTSQMGQTPPPPSSFGTQQQKFQ